LKGVGANFLTSESLPWDELSRAHQCALERLWAGGSLRGRDPAIVIGLRSMGYIEGDELTRAGEALCRVALTAMMARVRKSLRALGQHQQ
jgi:hypothetical protein